MDSKTTDKITARDLANWFICSLDREAGDYITHLKLQKLLYYAQSWSLVLNGEALFDEDFEAWSHGPVLPSIYQEYKDYGFQALPFCECEQNIDGEKEEVLEEVLRVYGEMSAKKLEFLAHREDPWKEARGGIAPERRSNAIITKERMSQYYGQLLEISHGTEA